MAEEKRIRQVLEDLRTGLPPDADAFDHVLWTLRQLARSYMSQQRSSHLLQTTALLNETYLRLFHRADPQWNDSEHFFNSASTAMRCILVDHARQMSAKKNGGSHATSPLDEGLTPGCASKDPCFDIVIIDDSLALLAKRDPDMARIVELHVFGGRTLREVAEILHCSQRSVEREWAMARAWLRKELRSG